MRKLIAIDPGHGLDTPGKRTPWFDDGTYMKEREFNKAVADELIPMIEELDFDVINVAENDIDVPLNTRTALANNTIKNKYDRPADLYISIHANAYGGGILFNSIGGVETYVHDSIAETSKTYQWASIIHNWLVYGTERQNRGVKKADYQVLRETTMPAILVECGFMTNLEEAYLLKTREYRGICAAAILAGINDVFEVSDIDSETPTAADEEADTIPTWQREGFNNLISAGTIIDPAYWEKRLEDNITVGELFGLLGRL